jgi:hypothetical protein
MITGRSAPASILAASSVRGAAAAATTEGAGISPAPSEKTTSSGKSR